MKTLPAVVLAILLSVGVTALWFTRQTARLVAVAAAHRAEKVEASRPEKPWDFWTPEMENLAKELAASQAALVKRDADLAAREKRLAVERAELDEIRTRVEAMRADIDAKLVAVEAEEQKNLKTLANTYSRLTPPAAVAIFREMDDAVVARILALMKPEVSSAILQQLGASPGPDGENARRAADLTQRLRLLVPPKPAG